MQITNRLSLLFPSIIVVTFLMVILPKMGMSQQGPLGCCTTNVHQDCVGCIGECSISEQLCGSDSFTEGYRCVDFGDQGVSCEPSFGSGCCEFARGRCADDVDFSACNGQGLAWFAQESCSNVPQCAPPSPKPIPSLTEWGLIALGGILVIAGLYAIRRRISNI
jgi:hypothetical protein